MNSKKLLRNPIDSKFANNLVLIVLICSLLYLLFPTQVFAQVIVNDFEVDLPIEKRKYQDELDKGNKEKALEHVIIIQQEYAGLNQWDSAGHYQGLVSDLALALGEKEIHLNAYINQMEIEGMFNRRGIKNRKEKIIYLDGFKEDPELNGFRKWSIYDKLARYAYDAGFKDSCIQLIKRAVIHSKEIPEKQVELAARRSLATYLKGMGRFDDALNELIRIESSKSFSLEEPYFQTSIFEFVLWKNGGYCRSQWI